MAAAQVVKVGIDVYRGGGDYDAAATTHSVHPILFAGLERLDQPRSRSSLVTERTSPQEGTQRLRVVEYGDSRRPAAMRRFDHAGVTELADCLAKLKCGPDLTVRGHRDVRAAHHSLHQRLVAEAERVVGQLPGNSSPGTDFSSSQDISFGKHNDALQAVAGNHLIRD